MKSHDSAFLCAVCSKAYRSRSALKFHLQKHQDIMIEFKCSVCEKIFASEKALKMHSRSHVRNEKLDVEKYLHRPQKDLREQDETGYSEKESNIFSEKVFLDLFIDEITCS